MSEGVETWRNTVAGTQYVFRQDRNGQVVAEAVPGGGVFTVTVDDRRWNSERAYDERVDPFRNGMFVPVRLVEGDEESVAEVASNPNVLTEDEMRELLRTRNWKEFDKRIGAIGAVLTLERLRALADEEDATARQVRIIEDRIASLTERPVEVEVMGSVGSPVPPGVTP